MVISKNVSGFDWFSLAFKKLRRWGKEGEGRSLKILAARTINSALDMEKRRREKDNEEEAEQGVERKVVQKAVEQVVSSEDSESESENEEEEATSRLKPSSKKAKVGEVDDTDGQEESDDDDEMLFTPVPRALVDLDDEGDSAEMKKHTEEQAAKVVNALEEGKVDSYKDNQYGSLQLDFAFCDFDDNDFHITKLILLNGKSSSEQTSRSQSSAPSTSSAPKGTNYITWGQNPVLNIPGLDLSGHLSGTAGGEDGLVNTMISNKATSTVVRVNDVLNESNELSEACAFISLVHLAKFNKQKPWSKLLTQYVTERFFTERALATINVDKVGLIITDKIVNVPEAITEKLYACLADDLVWAAANATDLGLPQDAFSFTHVVMFVSVLNEPSGESKDECGCTFRYAVEKLLFSRAKKVFDCSSTTKQAKRPTVAVTKMLLLTIEDYNDAMKEEKTVE